jgi:HlyD family secretion protein
MQAPQRLIPIALVSGLTLAWAISPGVPVRVKGAAVLLEPGSREGIYARSTGQIQELTVKAGAVVNAGTTVATINRIDQAAPGGGRIGADPQALLRQEQAINRQKQALRSQIATLRTTNAPVRAQLNALEALRREEVIPRYSPLWVGALNLYLSNQSTIRGLEGQLAALDANQAEVQAQEASLQVLAPRRGTLLSWAVTPGEAVAPGQRIASLGTPDGKAGRTAIAVFTEADASRLRRGMEIELSPQFQSRNDYGGSAARYGRIAGRISALSPTSLSLPALTSVVGDTEMAASLVARSREEGFGSGGDPLATAGDKVTAPVVLAQVELEAAPTASGLRWTRGKGPDFALSTGTPAAADVEIERRPLLNFLTPFLRWIGGLAL